MSNATDFWSRRKALVKAEADSERRALEAEQQRAERDVLEAKTDEEILAELKLPDPDELKAGDDFSAFMTRAVPERLRRRALRKLWLSNPVLANVDGLIDYGDDYTDAANVVENIQTSYLVGRGMLSHLQELARSEDIDAAACNAATEAEIADDGGAEDADFDHPQNASSGPSGANADVVEPTAKPVEPEPAKTARRMRFAVNRGSGQKQTVEVDAA